MKKKLWIILPIGLILISVFSVIVFGNMESKPRSEDPADEILAHPDSYVRKEAKEEIVIPGINKTPQKVTYAATQKINDETIDIYLDEDEVQYEVDSSSGELVGYFDKNSHLSDDVTNDFQSSGPITEEQAVSIAVSEAKRLFPEEFHLFTNQHMYSHSLGYTVNFAQMGGKGGFIKLRSISVDLTPEGKITWCFMRNGSILNDLDLPLIQNLKQEDVDAFVVEEVEKMGWTLERIDRYVLEKDESHYIRITVRTIGSIEEFTYPLGS